MSPWPGKSVLRRYTGCVMCGGGRGGRTRRQAIRKKVRWIRVLRTDVIEWRRCKVADRIVHCAKVDAAAFREQHHLVAHVQHCFPPTLRTARDDPHTHTFRTRLVQCTDDGATCIRKPSQHLQDVESRTRVQSRGGLIQNN